MVIKVPREKAVGMVMAEDRLRSMVNGKVSYTEHGSNFA
jgi:hypothetical protein